MTQIEAVTDLSRLKLQFRSRAKKRHLFALG